MAELGHIVPSSLVTPPVSQPSTPVQIRQHQHQYPSIIQSQMQVPMLTATPNINELMQKQQFQPLTTMNPSQNTPLTPPQEMLTLQSQFKAQFPSVVPEEEGGKGHHSFEHYQGNHLPHQYDYPAMFPSELEMLVPDVARQQAQFNSELMLHHPQPEPCTPTSNDSSSASNSPTLQSAEQFYLQPSASTGGYYQGLLSTPIDPYEFIVAYPQ
jgi:hypothetical protein